MNADSMRKQSELLSELEQLLDVALADKDSMLFAVCCILNAQQ